MYRANELLPTDLFDQENVPRFKVRYVDNQFYYPLNFKNEIPEKIETVILLCLEAIYWKTVPSNDIAAEHLLFNNDMLHIESVDVLKRMMNGSKIVVARRKDARLEL